MSKTNNLSKKKEELMETITILFVYNSSELEINCQKHELISSVLKKFIRKTLQCEDDLFFYYDGTILDKNDFRKISTLETDETKIKIIVLSKVEKEKNNFKETNQIICPKCKNLAVVNSINEYSISTKCAGENCGIINLSLYDFVNSQIIDQTKIICDSCKFTKADAYNNEFYICNCGHKFCPSCEKYHTNLYYSHETNNYEKKNFYCFLHCKEYSAYCFDCKRNMCSFCVSEDIKNHKKIFYRNILPTNAYIDRTKVSLNKLKEKINQLDNVIKSWINILEKIRRNMYLYYKINKNISEAFKLKLYNFEVIENYKKIYENISDKNKVSKDIDSVITDNGTIIEILRLMYNYINNYKIEQESYIKLFNNKYNININSKEIILDLSFNNSNISNNKPKSKLGYSGLYSLCKVKFNQLLKLYLINNDIDNLNPFSFANFPQLELLALGYNKINDLSSLQKMKFSKLKMLGLDNNNITNLKGLEKIKFNELEELYLNDNKINDISELANVKLGKLKLLNLDKNEIKDISVLENVEFNELITLSLGYNNIKNLLGLSNAKFFELKNLYLQNNEIKTINLLMHCKFKQIKLLKLSNNNINNINIFNKINFNELKELSLANNKIKNIDVIRAEKFSKLEKLYLNNNEISDIKVFEDVKFENIKELDLSYNNIGNLDALQNVKFSQLETLILDNIIIDLRVIKRENFLNLKKLCIKGVNLAYKANLFIYIELKANNIEIEI